VKKIQAISTVILFLGMIVLYYLHFSGTGKSSDAAAGHGHIPATGIASELRIAWVNSDSLWKNYAYVEEKRKELEAFNQQLESKYRGTVKQFEQDYINLEKEFNDYIQKGSAGLYTLDQQKAKEEEFVQKKARLEQKQASIIQLDQEYSLQLAEKEHLMNSELQDSIIAYINYYNESLNYTYIFAYSGGSALLFANDSLDITQHILKGLNDAYKKQKK